MLSISSQTFDSLPFGSVTNRNFSARERLPAFHIPGVKMTITHSIVKLQLRKKLQQDCFKKNAYKLNNLE